MIRGMVPVAIGLLFLGLVAQRIGRYATFEQRDIQMPLPVADADERNLFLLPAGKYTGADIAANGDLLPSEKFRGFRPQHDLQPQPGDRLCPITRTKANRECSWIVDGQKYEFCCPPCIAEFVLQAKQQPERILPREAYVYGAAGGS